MSLVLNKKKFVPSEQQKAYFNWIEVGEGSCIVEAVAGSGKTTTLIKGLEYMVGSIFFGAYNKKICDEIRAKAPAKDGLDISTMHAAGLAAWRKVHKHPEVDGDKVRNIFREAMFRNAEYKPFMQVVVNLVSLAKQNGFGVNTPAFPTIQSRQSWIDLINHFDVETYDDKNDIDNTDIIIKLAICTLKESIKQNTTIIDFDDMIFAPLYHNVGFKRYDWVLVDEAQDTNATRREMAIRMMKPTSRLVAVGDRRQAIYGFTGADSDALDLIAQRTNAKQLPLYISFRCPKAVVAYAQKWVSHIQAAETAKEGVVRDINFDSLFTEARVGDAILCRFNAPLVKYVYKFIAEGIPARIEGREIGNGIKTLASKWKVNSLDSLKTKLAAYYEREMKKFLEKDQEAKIVALDDKIECLYVIMERVREKKPSTTTPVEDIIAEVESIFTDDPKLKVVLLSSIHRSKGREWSRVIWLLTPENKRARLGWMLVQEDNLKYVAATRAQDELILCDVSADMYADREKKYGQIRTM